MSAFSNFSEVLPPGEGDNCQRLIPVWCGNWRSGCFSILVMDKAAEYASSRDGSLVRRSPRWDRAALRQPLMWPTMVVAGHIRGENPPQMAFTEDQQVV